MEITALILTFNESKHIRRCLDSLAHIVKEIIIVDSGSSDNTQQICREYGAKVFTRNWINYSDQFNWGLKQVSTSWVWRIDADEYIDSTLQQRIKTLKISSDFNAIAFKRGIVFKDKFLKKGGVSSIYHIKIWKKSAGYLEITYMDERLKFLVSPRVLKIHDGYQIDHNMNNINWWLNKHLGYAVREAADYFLKSQNNSNKDFQLNDVESTRRSVKLYYNKLPLGIRSIAYFLYGYILRGGFLDGYPSFVWHFNQALWYRVIVDDIIMSASKQDNPVTFLKNEYGLKTLTE